MGARPPGSGLNRLFSGQATLVETAALTALYAIIVSGLVHRDYSLWLGLRHAFRECIVLIGGVLIILASAKGFTAYMVDADIPFLLLDWTQANIESPLLFLLALNVFLLVVGCFMDIFSAIVVVVPLISEIGATFEIDPGASRYHLHSEPRARISHAASRLKPLLCVVPI